MKIKSGDIAMGVLGIGAVAMCACSWLFYDGRHGLEMFDTASDPVSKSDPAPSPSDNPKQKQPPEVVVFMSANRDSVCWQRCEAPLFQAAGWKVAYCYDHDYVDTPTFWLTVDGETVDRAGYLKYSSVEKGIKQ
jgi:hypothetical protein